MLTAAGSGSASCWTVGRERCTLSGRRVRMGAMDASKHRGARSESSALRALRVTVPDHLRARFAWLADFHATPEGHAFWEAAKAFARGDEAPMLELAKEGVEQERDALVVVKLREMLPQADDLTPRYMWEFLDSHKTRLKSRAEAGRLPEAAEIRSKIKAKGFASVDLALRYWGEGGEKRKDTLGDTIRNVAYIERAGLRAGSGKLAGRVASRLRREGIERPDKPGTVFAPGPEGVLMHADDQEAVAFASRELLTQKMFEAGVTDQEAESFEASVRLGSNEAASEEVGRSAGQVGVEKHRAFAKLRRVV